MSWNFLSALFFKCYLQEPALVKILEFQGVEGVILSSESICFAQKWAQQEEASGAAASSVAMSCGFASEQISKLSWGTLKAVVSGFEKKMMVHLVFTPLVVSIIGSDLDGEALASEELYTKLQKGFKPLIEQLQP